jgi:hypothetical protein
MQTSTAFAPSPQSDLQSDSFAAFLARLAELPDWDADEPSVQTTSAPLEEASEDDLASLSYEHALRAPARSAHRAEAKSSAKVQLATQPSPSLQIADPRRFRTTIRFTVAENDLLRTRATESGLAVSAYIRACVFEVESLRAQVKQLMTVASQPSHSATGPQAPALAALPPQPALAASPGSNPAPRPLQPPTARTPQPAPARRLDPRVQAAFDAQKRISAQSSPGTPEKKRPGLLALLFGNRRSA